MNGAAPSATDAQAAAAAADLRPGKLLIALSAVVIGGCLFMVGGAIGAMASTFDPCSAIGGAIMLPVPLFIAVQQYRGVFHRQAGAAFAAACCLLGFGGLFAFGAILNVVEFVSDKQRLGEDWRDYLPAFYILAIIGLVGLSNVLLGWRTVRWSKQLRAAGHGSEPRVFSLRELLAVVAVIGAVAGVARWTTDRRPSVGFNVPPETAPRSVPATAKNVCYRNGGRGTEVIEFTTDEATFRKWVAEKVEPLGHHKHGHQVSPLIEFSSPKAVMGVNGERHELKRGLSYHWHFEDQGVSAAFDAESGRAYFSVHWY
jgi:hypothetical protein